VGIDDGFLTPYKIEKYTSNIDDYSYSYADNVTQGQVDEDKTYTEYDMNKAIIIPDREEYRVKQFLSKIKPYEKAIVFCVTQNHALMIRDFINHHKPTHDLHYAERVTASDRQ
jgi:type I restriction enzyme, R subunit